MSINYNRFVYIFNININYSVNQNYCYILIIPGFGIVSQVVSTFSGKTIFGQYGSLIKLSWLMQQTICRDAMNWFIIWFINSILLNTKNILINYYSFLVKILVIMENPQITKARSKNYKPEIIEFFRLSMLVGISEAIRLLPTLSSKMRNDFIYVTLIYSNKLKEYFNVYINNLKIENPDSQNIAAYGGGDKNNNLKSVKVTDFNEWLAGIIDGDGCFLLTKKGYASLEISLQLRDKRILYLIKQKYGGSVKLYAGDNHLRYRLHHKVGLLSLINGINGLLRNPIRILQLGKICNKYDIILKDPQPLTYYNGWLSGFFDTDGSIYLNDKSGQIFITASQKNRFILDELVKLYGGQIYIMVKQDAFKWTCFRKKEILSLVNDYFKVNPCRSEKLKRLSMANRFYELRQLHAHSASPNSDLGKAWKHFLIKWNSLVDKHTPTS